MFYGGASDQGNNYENQVTLAQHSLRGEKETKTWLAVMDW